MYRWAGPSSNILPFQPRIHTHETTYHIDIVSHRRKCHPRARTSRPRASLRRTSSARRRALRNPVAGVASLLTPNTANQLHYLSTANVRLSSFVLLGNDILAWLLVAARDIDGHVLLYAALIASDDAMAGL